MQSSGLDVRSREKWSQIFLKRGEAKEKREIINRIAAVAGHGFLGSNGLDGLHRQSEIAKGTDQF